MKLTPLDIRKQEFSRKLRGYDPEEVRSFLQMVATQWEEVRDKHQRLGSKLDELRGKLEHYEKVEEALQEALHVTRESSEKTIRNAEEKARTTIEKAEIEAREIEEHARQAVNEIRRQASRLNDYRLELMARLRALLTSETELLARYEEHAEVVLNKLYSIGEGEKMQAPPSKTANGKSAARKKKEAAQTTDARAKAASDKAPGAQKIEETPEAEDTREGESSGTKDSSSDIQHIRRILSDLD